MSEVTEVVDEQVAAFFARDLERFVACYAPNIVVSDAAGQVLVEGHDALREMYGPLFARSPGLTGRIVNRIVVGDTVADHERVEGIDAGQGPMSVETLAIYGVAGGKIVRVTLCTDAPLPDALLPDPPQT